VKFSHRSGKDKTDEERSEKDATEKERKIEEQRSRVPNLGTDADTQLVHKSAPSMPQKKRNKTNTEPTLLVKNQHRNKHSLEYCIG
jgi:hypothetical protein